MRRPSTSSALLQAAAWPVWTRPLIALGAGALSVLGFAPFGFGLAPVIGLALLIWLWRMAHSRAEGAWIGYGFGLGLMGFGVFWLRISIAQFGGVHEALAVTITVAFILLMALYYALAGWLAIRLRGRGSARWLLLVVPGLWILVVEWLRGWLFTGFPWLALGYSQIELPLRGYAPVLGVYGVSLAVLWTAALLHLRPRLSGMVAILALWAGGALLHTVDWSRPAAEPIRVSILQGNIPQERKWLASMRQPTLDLYLGMTRQAADSQVVVWPETAVPAFDTAVERTLLAPLHAELVEQGRDVLLGIVAAGEGEAYYNAMLSLGISGRDHYYKRQLVPFGEYLPFDRWLRPVLDFIEIPMSDFSAGGDGKPLVTLAGQPVGVDICYEDAFAEEIIRALPEATLLINASNDAWFGDSLAPHQHLEIARMRAVETRRFLVRATNTGVSAMIDERGALRGVIPQFTQAVLTDEVTPRTGMTPFAYWGHWGVVIIAAAALLIAVVTGRRDTAA
jgi:apolipoprotein N-acyltransferase